MKQWQQFLLLTGLMVGINTIASISWIILSNYVENDHFNPSLIEWIETFFLLNGPFAFFQIFVIKNDTWWKILILPSIILLFQILFYSPHDAEFAVLCMGAYARILEIGIRIMDSFPELFSIKLRQIIFFLNCTGLLWLYLVGILYCFQITVQKKTRAIVKRTRETNPQHLKDSIEF